MKILVTGGTGYIGSHACVELLNSGHQVVILDDLSNSREEVATWIGEIADKPVKLYIGNIMDSPLLDRIFTENKIDAVMHFAGKKCVPESAAQPLMYYENNVSGSVCLFNAMKKHGCKRIVFSSSATVYGISDTKPIDETAPLSPQNVYGDTKLAVEIMLTDLYNSDNEWSVMLLRYFNPIGAHDSGLLGEVPSGVPNNLMPYITQVAAGIRPNLNITGADYDTPDGTGVRDYVHVVDLAVGHVRALEKATEPGLGIYNLGTGRGYSVKEVVTAFEKATGVSIPCKIMPRRAGDLACYFASPAKAEAELNWTAKKSIDDMCLSSWRFAESYYKSKE